MVVHGAAYLKFRKSPIGHSTRLKINNNEVLNIVLKTHIYKLAKTKKWLKALLLQ